MKFRSKLHAVAITLVFAAFCFGFLAPTASVAQSLSPTPAPTVQPTPGTPIIPTDASTLSEFLGQIVDNFIIFKDSFINTVEGTLGGYFSVLAYVLAWLIFIYTLIEHLFKGEYNASEIGRLTGSLIVTLLLLFYCGDVNNDGKRGDSVRYPGQIGYYFAFDDEPSEPSGYFISRTVNGERKKFTDNFNKFVENKLMVKINDNEMPVRYPGMQGVQTVAAVAIGQATEEQNKSVLSQDFWIGTLFFVMNGLRTVIEIVDFFLIVCYSFGILLCSIISPFMFCVFINPELRKRFTIPFIWTVLTITIIFPIISQGFRYLAYLCSNIALGASGNPVYSFDPENFTIIANSDPTPMIVVACLMMIISILLLVMSFILSYSFAQGRLLEAVNGIVANTFAGLSSVGIGAAVSAASTRMSAEGEKTQIEGNYDSSMTVAEHNKKAQDVNAESVKEAAETNAEGSYRQTMINAQASRDATNTSLMGSLIAGRQNVSAEKNASIGNSLASFNHNWKSLDAEAKKAKADNLVDLLKQNNDATSQRIAKEIELAPEKAGLLAAQYQNTLDGLPIISTLASTFGVNDKSMNSWMRTEGFKDTGQWLLGNPETGQRGVLAQDFEGSMGDNVFNGYDKQNSLINSNKQAQQMVYTRPDGTPVNAMTGEVIKGQPNQSMQTGNGNAQIFDAGNVDTSQILRQSGITNRSGGMTERQRGNFNAMKRMMKQDPNFLSTLQRESMKRGIDPNHVLNMVAIESGFRKNITNKDGYMGLGQVGRKERASLRSYGWTGNNAVDQRRLNSMSASQQLESLVFPFIDKKFGNKTRGISMARMYAGWGSGHVKSNDNMVHMAKGGIRSKAYKANPQWDFNKDGQTQQWEFGPAAYKNLGAGVFFDTNKAIGQIQKADPATANYLGKLLSANATQRNQMANNYMQYAGKNRNVTNFYDEKKMLEAGYTQEQIRIAQAKAMEQNAALDTTFNYGNQAANTTYQGAYQGASAGYNASMKSAGQIYGGSIQANQINFEGSKQAAEINRKAALEALYKRNMSSFTQSVGGSIAHQFSELFERASRGN